jgi:HEAT repeat protein
VRQLARVLARRGLVDPLREAVCHPDADVRRVVVDALAAAPPEDGAALIAPALDDPDADLRLAALTAWRGEGEDRIWFDPEALRVRLGDPDVRVRAAAARALGADGEPTLARMARDADPPTAIAALGSLPASLVDAALERVDDPEPRVRAAAIEGLARIARPVPLDVDRLIQELAHPETAVRRAAVSAVATRHEPEAGKVLARALADPSREVRLAAARELAALGRHGVGLALGALDDRPLWTAEAALLAVAWSGTPLLQTILVDQFRLRARQAWNAFRACHALPAGDDLGSRFLRAAYEDALRENRKLAFRILELMGDAPVVRTVEKVLLFGSGRLRAEALEVLSHLGDREGAHYLVMTLEHVYLRESGSVDDVTAQGTPDLERIFREAVRAIDRWIRVASTAPVERGMEAIMERLLALRNVPLFSEMSLDQLEAINTLLVEQEFVSGELIFREGDPGTDLFLVMRGSVDIVQSHGTEHAIRLAHLGEGFHFGEIAVLDEAPRTASGVAAEDCTLLALSGDRFKELIYDMPELAFAIFRVLTSQVRRADERLSKIVRGDLARTLTRRSD